MPNERQVPVPIEEEMRKSYLDYAMSVIVGRALPDIRDGLKPVHRRVLYTMHNLGLAWNRAYKKSAKVVGEVLGKYHPHGDSPVYEALVRMVQEFSLRYPLVDGQGNFGSIDGDPPAAYRYTEARLAKIAHEMLADIDKDTVDFAPNFDESEQEPTVLPTRLPNLLVNGSAGIAVGMATNIPPHNLSEVVDGLVMRRGESPPIVMNQLYKHTQMQTTFGIIMLALVDRRPQVVDLKQMLDAFVRFRREIVTRRTRFDLARAEERAHILAGLRKAVEHLDQVIRLIRQAESPDAAKDALMARLDLSEIQAKAILEMRLQRLTQLERHKVVEEHEQTLGLIEEQKGILASDTKLMGIIRKELLELKEEYGDVRRTEILTETAELTIEDLLADEEMVVTITRSGYIKRTHVESYRSQRRGGKGVTGMETKEEDIVEDLFVASTHSY